MKKAKEKKKKEKKERVEKFSREGTEEEVMSEGFSIKR